MTAKSTFAAAGAVLAAAAVTAGALLTGGGSQDTFPLTVASQTPQTITLTWAAQPGADGYQFVRDGVAVSRTFDPARLTVKFAKGTSYAVNALDVTTQGQGVYPPATPPPPITTTTPGAQTDMTPAQFEQAATSGATITDKHVTGWVTIRAANVTVRNVAFDGGFTIEPSADDLSIHGGTATSFYLWGAKRVLIDGTVFDGHNVTDDAKLWGRDGKLPSLTLRNCVMKHFSHDADPGSHNQALFIGSSEWVVVEGCRFDDNGNTAHLFVSSFGAINAVPGYVCIRNNTFGPTHGAFFSVNVHPDEIPATAKVFVAPGQPSVKPLVTPTVFARPCP